MNPWLVVPTLGNRDSLWPLLRDADMPVVVVWTNPDVHVGDQSAGMNIVRSGNRHGITFVTDFGPINIHRWWRRGIDVAISSGCDVAVLCNDDVHAAPGELKKLAGHVTGGVALAYLDRPEHAAPRVTGITGWCFALDFWRVPIVDGECDPGKRANCPDLTCTHLQWWYGDHDIELRALTGGRPTDMPERIAKVPGLGIHHLRRDWHYDRSDEIYPLIRRDRDIFYQRWGWKVGDGK